MKKTTIKIGGVPEHFNLPWHLAIENSDFDKLGLHVIWQDFYGGTGAMTKALREKEVDVAIVLTEGIIADIVKGNPAKIVGQYVTSSLVWGIHTAADAPFENANDLKGGRYSISRLGSGSHIMTFVDAINRGWAPQEQRFVKVGNLDGARKALTGGEADALLWEKFTTKPYVDSGELKRVGETVTPWPCFVIAVHEDFLEEKQEAIEKMLYVIHKGCRRFMEMPNVVELVAERYGLQEVDAEAWFKQTTWATNTLISKAVLRNVLDTLHDVKVIEEKVDPQQLCYDNIIKFEKRIFKFTNKEESAAFFEKEMQSCLEQLKVNTPNRWGIMTPQHMVEHLISTLMLSTGESTLPDAVEKERQPKIKDFLIGDKMLSKRVTLPGFEATKLAPLRFANLEQAKDTLHDILAYTFKTFEDNPDFATKHPYGGLFSGAEWRIFHYKHFVHHFRQFGVI